jgi:diguanylate cyclase (GGDEF)-like protein
LNDNPTAALVAALTPARPRSRSSRALRLARDAWRLLHVDSAKAIALAEQALGLATHDDEAASWARLARGYHLLYFATPGKATQELLDAQRRFDARGERGGSILAAAGLARAQWRAGRFRDALAQVLPLRDEGLDVLRNEQRSVLLNTIAGCYSALGESEQAFAYMYEALRDAPPSHGHGFDAVLHCNLANELMMLGDYLEALRHIDDGLARCHGLRNPRLVSILLINRIVCLTELGRAEEALPDIEQVRSQPTDASGRGSIGTHFETMAIAALRAGAIDLGRSLVAAARQVERPPIPDEHLELALALALLASADEAPTIALAHLTAVAPLAGTVDGSDGAAMAPADGLSLRLRCMYFQILSELRERSGDHAGALAAIRSWQQLQVQRAQLASRARYQAAALQTELLRLKHKLVEQDVKRRATERARTELETLNGQLSRRIEQVQSLEAALREMAVRDELTRLFNRRHLNAVLPGMLALARRNREPLTVVIIDLDDFKGVNDAHGHLAGDQLLAAFGSLLAASCRSSDVACRYGGEEFCLLMPRTAAEAAARKTRKILRRWREMSFNLNEACVTGLTFSAGAADSQRAGTSATELLTAADDLALAAKRLGRNRVLTAATAVDLPASA